MLVVRDLGLFGGLDVISDEHNFLSEFKRPEYPYWYQPPKFTMWDTNPN